MQEISAYPRALGCIDSRCFIPGPRGQGKEVVAKGDHVNRPRRERPFVALNLRPPFPTRCWKASRRQQARRLHRRGSESRRHLVEADGGTNFSTRSPSGLRACRPRLAVLQEGSPAAGAPRRRRSTCAWWRPPTKIEGRASAVTAPFARHLRTVERRAVPPAGAARSHGGTLPILEEHFMNPHRRQAGKEVRGFTERRARRYGYDGRGT